MPGNSIARAAILLLGLVAASVRVQGQYEDLNFDGMVDGYGDMYGGDYGDMSALAGMMGGMGYGGYGYGESEASHTDLVDMADVDKFLAADPQTPCVIGFYSEDTDGEDIMTFRTAAQRMSHFGIRFGLATEDDVRKGLNYKSGRVMAYPAKRFMAEGDRAKQRYPGAGTLDPESLQMWVLKAVTPLVGLFTWETGGRYQEIGLPELTAFTKVDLEGKGDDFDQLAATLRRVATARLPERELSFVIANVEDMSSLAERFKFPEDATPPAEGGIFVGIRKQNEFYRMDGDFNEENVAAFADAYIKGSLKPVHVEVIDEDDAFDTGGGQIEDEDEDEAGVVVLTPDNFDAVVMEKGKDVMLEFYAPWCGHCKSLKPVYAEVAEEVSSMPSVVVAKMDASTHTPPEDFTITSFPTLTFLKAGDKSNPIPYRGARDKDSIVAFIRENASPAASAEL